jgi:endonuclease YncB( thermonuclease family)
LSTLLLAACLVLSVSDGDTMKVQCPQRVNPVTVRVAAIDAPETAKNLFGVKVPEQPGAQAAKKGLADLCLGQKVDVKRLAIDRDERWIALVLCRGRDASVAQIASGRAWVLDPPKAQAAAFYALQEAARRRGDGIWADPDVVNPSTWRKAASCSR